MIFTEGQLNFAIFFFILFFIGIIYAYRSDFKRIIYNKYDGLKVLVFILVVMISFYALVRYLAA